TSQSARASGVPSSQLAPQAHKLPLYDLHVATPTRAVGDEVPHRGIGKHHDHERREQHRDERNEPKQDGRSISRPHHRAIAEPLHQMSPSSLSSSVASSSGGSVDCSSITRRSPSAACSGVTPRSTSSSYSSSTPAPHSSIAPIDSALTIGTSTCFSSDMTLPF